MLKRYHYLGEPSLTQISGQINGVLSRYGHTNKTYDRVGNFTEKWDANELHYTATITISQKNGQYYGSINLTSKDKTGQDNPMNLPFQNDSQDPINNPDFYKPTDTTGNNKQFINIANVIIGTMRAVGTVISVVALMAIGLKFMMGTVAEKAAYKETMIPYLIGAVMLFTIPNILGILYDLVKGINM